jgi:hypothetical protein
MLLYLALATVIAAPTPDVQYKQPQVAANGQRAVVTFGAGNAIYVTASADGGRTFAKPVTVAEPGVISLGRHRGPRVALAGDAIVVTVIAGPTGRGVDGDVLAFRSTDGGRTWSTGIRVNDASGSAREGLHTMAASGRNVFAAWLDLRSKGTKIYGSVSRDGGLTWSKNTVVYASPDGSVCECCHPSAAIDHTGHVYVMFRNSLAGSRDLYVARSSDGGQSFAHAVKMGSGTWQLNACPMDGGGLALTNVGKALTVWRRGKEIFTAADDRSEEKLGLGKDPAIAMSAKGAHTAWSGEGGLHYKSPGQNEAPVLDPDGAFVQLAPAAGGRVVAVWERKGAIVSDLLE